MIIRFLGIINDRIHALHEKIAQINEDLEKFEIKNKKERNVMVNQMNE
jgi:hypothetical protein